jgi:hypothetical protein
MFKSHVPLKFDEHRDMRVADSEDYSFARTETLAPIMFSELGDIAREYPIIFPNNASGLPCALLGLELGQNAYVSAEGRWLGTYIPAHIRRYPFMLARTGSRIGEKDGFVVVFDPDAPNFQDPDGYLVFNPDGTPTEPMKRRLVLLQEMQRHTSQTMKMVRIMEDLGILVERQVTIRKANSTNQIHGLRVVDEATLNGLSDDDFLRLRRAGVLPLVYAHLLSWANFRQGPIAGRYPDLASRAGKGNEPALSDDETIDFSQFS